MQTLLSDTALAAVGGGTMGTSTCEATVYEQRCYPVCVTYPNGDYDCEYICIDWEYTIYFAC